MRRSPGCGRGPMSTLVDVSPSADDALGQVEEQLRTALSELEPLLAQGTGPVWTTDRGELVVSRLSAATVAPEVETLRGELTELLPRPQLTELRIEVDRWVSFTGELSHAGDKTHRDQTLHRNLYAAVLAQACNFGLTAMAEASGISYDTLAWTTDGLPEPLKFGRHSRSAPGRAVLADAAHESLGFSGHSARTTTRPA
jgi:hypothetical protein